MHTYNLNANFKNFNSYAVTAFLKLKYYENALILFF